MPWLSVSGCSVRRMPWLVVRPTCSRHRSPRPGWIGEADAVRVRAWCEAHDSPAVREIAGYDGRAENSPCECPRPLTACVAASSDTRVPAVPWSDGDRRFQRGRRSGLRRCSHGARVRPPHWMVPPRLPPRLPGYQRGCRRTTRPQSSPASPSSASAHRRAVWPPSRRSSPVCPRMSDPGMAFVLVQHLAPDHNSILSALIQRYTRMRVVEVEDGMGEGRLTPGAVQASDMGARPRCSRTFICFHCSMG